MSSSGVRVFILYAIIFERVVEDTLTGIERC